ncbi:MAG TPA: DUF420 domain-containing protein [Pyrinomonadaceae bacterium]|nr:DUF420 domain-containing protein [Pyrinomonadaceae bacterium]
MDYSILPHVNALLNTTSGLLLLAGFYFISRRRVTAHLRCMTAAFVVSCIFLVSYLVYHYQHGDTKFTGEGFIRPVYLTILATHVILAIVIVPLILVTLWRAWRGDFGRHRRIARWTFPLWLYVSATGVVVYLMLYHLYPAR